MVNTITNKFIIISFFILILSNNVFAEVSKSNRIIKNSVTVGVAYWGEQISLITSDSRSENIVLEYSGINLGYNLSQKINNFGIHVGVESLLLRGQAQSEGQSILYKDKVSSFVPLILESGVTLYPSALVLLEFGLGIVYYQLKLTPPSSIIASYEFKYSKPVQVMAQMKLSWQLSKEIFFQQSLFAVENTNAASGWTVSLGYMF